MDILVVMRGREDNPRSDKVLSGDVCFIKKQGGSCIRTRSYKGNPLRPKYWWVAEADITVLSKKEVS